MALKTMSLLQGATVAASGGTALAFADDGAVVPNGLHVIVPADTDFRTRRNVTFKNRASRYDPNSGSYAKGKRSASYQVPTVLDNGTTVFNMVRIEVEVHPEVEAAQIDGLRTIGAQLLVDSDTDSFWTTGSLS